MTKNFFDFQKNMAFYRDYKTKYDLVKSKNIKLKTAIINKNSPFEIEKAIRNKLNLGRPNEAVAIIPSPGIAKQTPTPSPVPIPLQWLRAFVPVD